MLNFARAFALSADTWRVAYKGTQVMMLKPHSIGGWIFQASTEVIYTYRLDRQGD